MTKQQTGKRTVSLAALTVVELEPDEAIRVAQQAGYDKVGLRLIAATPEQEGAPVVASPAKLQRIKSALRETGIGVLDIEILRLQPETRVSDFRAVLEMGAELGATEILVAGNDPNRQRLIDNFSALCELGQPMGLGINLEFMPWTDIPDLAQASAVLDRVEQGNAGLLVDAFHLNRSGSALSELAAQPTSRFRYVQLCDIAGAPPADMAEILREARAERLFPGQGDIDLSALLVALPDSTPLSIEVPSEALKTQGLTALQRAKLAFEHTLEVLS